MTEILYEQDAFLIKFEAKVLSCEKGKKGFDIVLDRTAFYPEGGGQPYDTGKLGGVNVLEVHNRDGEIVHICNHPLEPGTLAAGRSICPRGSPIPPRKSCPTSTIGAKRSLPARCALWNSLEQTAAPAAAPM